MNDSYKDLREIEFNEKKLNNKNFKNARAGQKLFSKIKVAIFSLIAGSLLSIIPCVSGGLLGVIISIDKDINYFYLLEGTSIILYFTSLAILNYWGFKVPSAVISIVLLLAGILYISEQNLTDKIGIGGTALILGISIILAWIGVAITAFFLALTSICCGIVVEYIAILGYAITAGLITFIGIINASPKPTNGEVIFTLVGELLVIFTGAVIARQAEKGSPKFTWLREKAVFWAATGGTSFYGAEQKQICVVQT